MDEEQSEPKEDQELEEKLREIEARAAKGRASHRLAKPEYEQNVKGTQSSYKGLGLGLMMAYGLIGFPIVCYGIGWWIDQQVGGTLASALLTVFGMVCAVAWVVIIAAKHQN